MLVAGNIFFTFLLSSLIIFLFLLRFLRPSGNESPRLFFLCLGLGPITISWLLYVLLIFVPHKTDIFYLLSIYGMFGLMLLVSLKQLSPSINKFHFDFKGYIRSFSPLEAFLIFLFLFIVVSCVVLISRLSSLPVVENDAIQYAQVARMVYQYKTVSFYPVITPDPISGFYATSSHPMGFMTLMTWLYMCQGSSDYSGIIKIINPIFTIYLLLLLWNLLSKKGKLYGPVGMLAYLSTPILFWQSSQLSIDPFRVFLLFLAAIWVFESDGKGNRRWCIIAGYAVGMSMFSHSIGAIFSLPFLSTALFGISKESISNRLINILILGFVACAFGSWQLVKNFIMFGSPIYDGLPVYQLKMMEHQYWIRCDSNLTSFQDRIVKGFFKGFSKYHVYGLGYWFAIIAVVFHRKQPYDKMFTGSIIIILLFYSLVAFSIVVGNDVFISNDRYLLTVQPFIAYLGAYFVHFFKQNK